MRPTLFSGLLRVFEWQTMLTASCWACRRVGRKSPFRMYSLLSTLSGEEARAGGGQGSGSSSRRGLSLSGFSAVEVGATHSPAVCPRNEPAGQARPPVTHLVGHTGHPKLTPPITRAALGKLVRTPVA